MSKLEPTRTSSDLTATERLRRMLDECGVEYRTYGTTDRTWFEVGNISWFVIERENGNLTADAVFLTPEQAIAVTLGTGTCKVVSSTLHEYEGGYAGSEWEHELSCDHTVWWSSGDSPEWCPWCGKKVVTNG